MFAPKQMMRGRLGFPFGKAYFPKLLMEVFSSEKEVSEGTLQSKISLPETNGKFAPEKMDGWNTIHFPLGIVSF